MSRSLAACILSLLVVSTPVDAGQTGFGEDGQMLSAVPGFDDATAFDVAIDGLGRVVISGLVGSFEFGIFGETELFLLRYLPDGRVDPAFAGGTGAITAFGGSMIQPGGLVIEPDGRIAQLGPGANILPGEGSLAVARVVSNGSPDALFDGDGQAVLTFPVDSLAGAQPDLARLGDGRYVLAGTVHGSIANPEAGLIMVSADGSLDATFDGDGFVTSDFTAFEDEDWSGVAIDDAGGIIVAGATQSPRVGVVARYLSSGAVDAGFGSNGATLVPFDEQSQFSALAIDAEGRIIAGGCPLVPGFVAQGFGLVRLSPDGTPDPSFGTAGTVVTDLQSEAVPEPNGCIMDLKIDAKGRIVVAGWAIDPASPGQQVMVAARYLDTGSLDPGFGTGGVVRVFFPGQQNALAEGVAIGADGRIFLAGTVRMADGVNMAGVQCLTEYGFACRDYPFEYAAKVVCGVQTDILTGPVARGFYTTTINIHNPATTPTTFFKKLALTRPPRDQTPGDVLPISEDRLAYDEALATDCPDLWRRFFPDAAGTFLEGFVVIQSAASLDVTGVYSTAALDENDKPGAQSSIDIEDIRERLPGPQLSVTKTAVVVPWEVIDNLWWHGILYTVAVTNSGDALLPDVTVIDEQVLEHNAAVVGFAGLFADLVFLPPGVSVLGTPTFTPPAASIAFDVGALAPGETKEIRFGALALHYVFGTGPESVLRDTVTVLSGGAAADADASTSLATFLFGP